MNVQSRQEVVKLPHTHTHVRGDYNIRGDHLVLAGTYRPTTQNHMFVVTQTESRFNPNQR